MDWTHFPRWLTASVAYHFQTETSIELFVETDTKHIDELPAFIEVRVDGPYITTLQSGFYDLECLVNILYVMKKDLKDVYALQRGLGKILQAATKSINFMRWGDDESQIACLNLVTSEKLVCSYLGKTGDECYQGFVQGHYKTEIEE